MFNPDYFSLYSVSEKLARGLITEFQALYKELTPETIPLIHSFVKSHFSSLKEIILNEGINIHTINSFKLRKFIKEHPKQHKSLFEKISLLLTLCAEYGASVSTLSDVARVEKPLLDVLLNLYLHAWNIADEVFYLLSGGYGNAAQSRWRSLYEIFIISLFILEKGDECAVAFMEHAVIDEYGLMNKAMSFKDEIRQCPPTEVQYNDCQSRYDFIISKYDKSFGKPYGWAKKYFNPIPKSNITFTKIEECVKQTRMRFYYSNASIDTHPSAYSLYKYDGGILTNKRGNTLKLEAGHALALTLVQIASAVCVVIPPSIESLFMISILVELTEQIASEFNR